MHRRRERFALVVFWAVLFAVVGTALGQSNTGTISGEITDSQGLGVRGATITLTNLATDTQRTTISNDEGRYALLNLVPGEYKLRVDGAANMAPYEIPSLIVKVGQAGIRNITLQLGTQTQSIVVNSEPNLIEPGQSENKTVIDTRQIENLPSNGRNYLNFALIDSRNTRDVSPTIGPAPNSGLNISGARGRGNMVSVDGADAGDNSVNGVRSTVSQEAVAQFEIIESNYNPEYGRATGGVVNIVTKSGSNDFHGNVYGYLRNKAFQARNAFSGEVDDDGNLVPTKQAYTRVQTGVTLGGALKNDKTFYFFSYEYTQREETGFSSIGEGKFGLVDANIPVPGGVLPVQLTADQASAVNSLLSSGVPALQTLGVQYGVLMGSASSVATNRLDYGALVTQLSGGTVTPANPVVTPGGVLFGEFPFPVSCPFGTTVNSIGCDGFARIGPGNSTVAAGAVPLPSSYVGLNSIRGNFPISEKTSLWSGRLDQIWNNRNSSFVRVGVSPSLVTGIQSTSQNQVFGQNAGSRTGLNQSRDFNVTFENTTTVDNNTVNQFRFQFARRGLHFGYSNLEGGSDIGVNIPGYAYFGREPYSVVDRIERRYQFTDGITWIHGRHAFKFGADVNIIQLRSSKPQIFQLDFGGVANFGGLSASTFGFPDSVTTPSGVIALPGTTGLQSYGLGVPTTYIQGIGQSNQPFDNLPFGFYAQDSWKVTPKVTLNYGLRYDVEISPLFAPATAVNAAAEKALGVVEGIPRDYNNVSPRIGVAWNVGGDGKTVVRAGYGLFYDHPLLAIAFNSVTADGGRSVQLISAGGQATACGLVTVACGPGLDSPTNLNGSSIFQGALNALPSMSFLPDQQRFDPLAPNSLFANQNYLTAGFPLPILPFTLPVDKNFVYGYAQQANLTVEHVFAKDWKVSAGYQWTRGLHLNRPIDINSTDPALLTQNSANAIASGVSRPGSSPLTVVVPSTAAANSCVVTGASSSVFLIAPGALGVGYGGSAACSGTPVGYVGTPAFFNYFRPSGPNPSFADIVPGGYETQVGLAGLAGFPVGFGAPVPFNSVDTQKSDASSWYNALTVSVERQFTGHFQLLSTYTWSHSIDDGTDLQSTLEPADSRFPYLDRGNSVNDQRHRWVTSGVFQTSPYKGGESFGHRLLSNITVAPLIDVSSGRPFNVITGTDTRLDLGASEIRPQATGGTTSPFIPGFSFGEPQVCLTNDKQPLTDIPGITPPLGCTGNLGRNRFVMPMFFQFDMRVSKGINLGERFRVDLIADVFNLFNHTNILAVNQLCDPSAASCSAGQPSAAYDARQFQFALKFSW